MIYHIQTCLLQMLEQADDVCQNNSLGSTFKSEKEANPSKGVPFGGDASRWISFCLSHFSCCLLLAAYGSLTFANTSACPMPKFLASHNNILLIMCLVVAQTLCRVVMVKNIHCRLRPPMSIGGRAWNQIAPFGALEVMFSPMSINGIDAQTSSIEDSMSLVNFIKSFREVLPPASSLNASLIRQSKSVK